MKIKTFQQPVSDLTRIHVFILSFQEVSGSRKFCQRRSNSDKCLGFLGVRRSYTTYSGPPSVRQRNANEMVFFWPAEDGQTLNAGVLRGFGPLLLKNLIFVIFHGEGGGGGRGRVRSPPLDRLNILGVLSY